MGGDIGEEKLVGAEKPLADWKALERCTGAGAASNPWRAGNEGDGSDQGFENAKDFAVKSCSTGDSQRPTEKELAGVAPGTQSGVCLDVAAACCNALAVLASAEMCAACLGACCQGCCGAS